MSHDPTARRAAPVRWTRDGEPRLRGTRGRPRLRAGLRLIRPDQVVLIVVVYVVGAIASATLSDGSGSIPWAQVLLAGAAVACIAISVHAVNEWADAETDALTVRTRFSGGSGALSDHGLSRRFALAVAVSAAALGAGMIGLGVVVGSLSALVSVLLVIGLVGGWQYSVAPLRLAWHGWGEVSNSLLGALLLPVTGAVAAGGSAGAAVPAYVPFTLLAFVNLLETQWSDRKADRAVGKLSLASRCSPRDLRRLGGTVVVATYVLAPVLQPWPVALAGLVALPLSVWGVRRLGRGGPGPSVAAMLVFLVAQGAAWLVLAAR